MISFSGEWFWGSKSQKLYDYVVGIFFQTGNADRSGFIEQVSNWPGQIKMDTFVKQLFSEATISLILLGGHSPDKNDAYCCCKTFLCNPRYLSWRSLDSYSLKKRSFHFWSGRRSMSENIKGYSSNWELLGCMYHVRNYPAAIDFFKGVPAKASATRSRR